MACLVIISANFLAIMQSIAAKLSQEDKPSKKKNETPSVASKKPKAISNCLMLVGASGSGKTSLFYSLFTGEFRYTVSSIEENLSGKDEPIKLGDEIERRVQTIDIPGHFNFRERI